MKTTRKTSRTLLCVNLKGQGTLAMSSNHDLVLWPVHQTFLDHQDGHDFK